MSGPSTGSGPVALIVDDDLMMRMLIRQTLERAGFVCHEAEHGAAALERLPRLQPDIVLLDVVMPHMDGYAACAALRGMPAGAFVPVLMLTGPAPACRKALAQAGMAAQDIDLWEINEAFAVVPIETMRSLGIDAERVNVNGGAIALGHPLGATGAILLGTLLDELERTDRTTGLVTMCIGGGQGIAMIIERV